jgi:hypothetical protein
MAATFLRGWSRECVAQKCQRLYKVSIPPAPPAVIDPHRIAVGLGDRLAAMVLDERRARLTQIPTPFLRRGHIWSLLYLVMPHGFRAQIGELPDSPSVQFDSTERLLAFVRAAGLALDSNAGRVAYVKYYLAFHCACVVESESDFDFLN